MPKKKIVPATTDQITALAAAMPPELSALVTFGAGTGMRQGEVFGLSWTVWTSSGVKSTWTASWWEL